MGLEQQGFDAVPEPVVNDESQRVDDVEKAQVMAQAEIQNRDNAKILNDSKETPIETFTNAKSVKLSSALDNFAGSQYIGFSGENKDRPDEELREVIEEKAINEINKAELAGEEAGKKFDADREAKLAETKKALGIE